MATVYCPRCSAPAASAAARCPVCGAADPGRWRAAVVGSLLVATIVAAAVVGLFAFVLSHFWERWEAKFAALPDDHALHGCAWDVAFVAGVGLFGVTWVVAAARLCRACRPGRLRAPARR